MHGTIIFMTALAAAVPAAADQAPTLREYPPCSRSVTDSCVQTTDKANGEAETTYQGVGGPYEPIDDAVEEHASAAPDEGGTASLNERGLADRPEPD